MATFEIKNQAEFMAHAVLLGYENRGHHVTEDSYLMVHRDLPMLSANAYSVLFLTHELAGVMERDFQKAFDAILDKAKTNG